MFDLSSLQDAARTVYAAMPPTPQYAWPLLSARIGATVWVKHENHTPTGAFKVRGGLVYVEALLRRYSHLTGLVTATRGNHGQSLAYACRAVGVGLWIVVPKGNSREKNAAMRALGATVIECGRDFDEAREHAAALAQSKGYYQVPAFHTDLVRGVATYALELFEAVHGLDTVYVPIGMGSGICGLIQARDLLGLKTEIVGVVSSTADAFAQSFEQGCIVTTSTAQTLADGMACRIPEAEPLAVVRQGAARIVRVTDEEVCRGIKALYEDTHNLAEGAGAAALAALLKERAQQQGRQVAVILSGANIDRDQAASILAEP
ncbi:threonine dehydratase [Pseudomonas duriflava]|uniref:Threonine dehydratase n=1 Tax=Pseudomonas duriflava TaxID=459528 RepID=A0A562Q8F1_9PSED|nr:threonine dehydratase [Pseudomonas duriflava]TWI52470.1 threonine dehydratase [Pseudomonas duriflava]